MPLHLISDIFFFTSSEYVYPFVLNGFNSPVKSLSSFLSTQCLDPSGNTHICLPLPYDFSFFIPLHVGIHMFPYSISFFDILFTSPVCVFLQTT